MIEREHEDLAMQHGMIAEEWVPGAACGRSAMTKMHSQSVLLNPKCQQPVKRVICAPSTRTNDDCLQLVGLRADRSGDALEALHRHEPRDDAGRLTPFV